uniref:Uncharacterized protein n=1 Tax=Candidatus Kentrum sp. FM TaxID=2126340 RepID=A0A450SKU2_9GAMM|nr:MAG: hypothetical protein BECKFM1743A_GA0114220_101276 [Candidatus Kentron sp. FM]VFJ66919.1 MAG: hypothetical protein BECKFM1743C_GA0114222_104402 [Candidatus Kentron sp. FM]VFK12578.1 MAG: hypothetical protein BECKFM1743B_GA0114221_102484 [Candidatus Kentron sp. FM]
MIGRHVARYTPRFWTLCALPDTSYDRGIFSQPLREKEEIARAMLGDGMAIDIVSKYSGLPENEIQQLMSTDPSK